MWYLRGTYYKLPGMYWYRATDLCNYLEKHNPGQFHLMSDVIQYLVKEDRVVSMLEEDVAKSYIKYYK